MDGTSVHSLIVSIDQHLELTHITHELVPLLRGVAGSFGCIVAQKAQGAANAVQHLTLLFVIATLQCVIQ
jgi:hypothetical protein